MPDARSGAVTAAHPGAFSLPVGDDHRLYVETVGPAGGAPALFLHGGPGSGCQPAHRRLFDQRRHFAVLFDQRGAGRSLPALSRKANTTAHLIDDIEALRTHLRIERWLVVGGSWGATLGLAYAESHPQRVTGLVLRATFLGTRSELEQAFGDTLARFHPGLHDDFVGMLPPAERARPLDAYWRRILDPDPAVHAPFARAWHDTEQALSRIAPAEARLDMTAVTAPVGKLPSTPFMEAHYFSNGCFMKDGALLAASDRLAGIPGVLVQGRYDLLCPPATAAALAARWPGARIHMLQAAGHSLDDPGVADAVRSGVAELTG
ncbi:MAG TPA: prolyl aminopeptidase [Devosiaceae bacterium]|nr:prolyl aminopeptidase [Devosiaceae bacterium]